MRNAENDDQVNGSANEKPYTPPKSRRPRWPSGAGEACPLMALWFPVGRSPTLCFR